MDDKDRQVIADALQTIGEQMINVEKAFAELSHEVRAVKGILASLISPDDAVSGLALIQRLQDEIAKRDPRAEDRKQSADILEAVKLIQKHGLPRQS